MKNIVPIIIVVVIITGIVIFTQKQDNTSPQAVANIPAETQEVMEEVSSEHDGVMEGEVSAPGVFVELANVDIASLDGDVVLDFSAPWCPSCRRFKKDVEASLNDIPSDLTLILVDYDSNKALRRQYGVTSQHTFVQIDNQGNKISMWSGGNTLEAMVAKIQ